MDYYRHARDLLGSYRDQASDGQWICSRCGTEIKADEPMYVETDGAADAGPSVTVECPSCHGNVTNPRR